MADGVHGRGKEQPDGLVDVRFGGDGRKRELGEGFGDADDGFELPHGDGDRAAGGGGQFVRVHLPPDGDEVRGELLGGGGGEVWGTAAAKGV